MEIFKVLKIFFLNCIDSIMHLARELLQDDY